MSQARMNRRDCLIGLAALIYSGACADAAEALTAVATEALTALDEAGFRRMVGDHRGKVLLVDFWATWCAPCREEMPKVIALVSEQHSRGVELVTISCDDPEQEAEAAQFVNARGAPGPHYVRHAKSDEAFIDAIDPKWSGALPALFLFDRSGTQVQSFIGETDMKQLEAAIGKTLSR